MHEQVIKVGQLWRDPADGELLLILKFGVEGNIPKANGLSWWPPQIDIRRAYTHFQRNIASFEHTYELVSDVYEC